MRRKIYAHSWETKTNLWGKNVDTLISFEISPANTRLYVDGWRMQTAGRLVLTNVRLSTGPNDVYVGSMNAEDK